MTISTTTSRVSYPGTGSTGPFAFPFKIFANTDLLVIKRASAGTETTLVLGTDYTVAGVGDAAGTLTLVVALAVGETLIIRRKPTNTQPMSIRNQGAYFPATIEDEFDRMAMQILALQDAVDRSVKLKESVTGGASLTELEPTAGQAVVGTGTGFTMSTISSTSTVALPGESRTVSSLSNYLANNAVYNVKDYGALGTGKVVGGVITGADDLAAFNACRTAAFAGGGAIYIPPLPLNFFYRLTGAWVLTGMNDIRVFGNGTRSLLCIHNAAGANCLTMDNSWRFSLESFAITGVVGSGHGIELINASHRGQLLDMLVQWTDGDGFKVTSGLSTRFINCRTDQNNGYDLAALGVLRGNIDNGFHVAYQAGALTSDTRMIACVVEAGAGHNGGYGVKVGDSALGQVLDFRWIAGMVEGLEKCWYIRASDALIEGTYVEPPTGVITNYVVTIDRCTDTVIKDGVIQGDCQLLGACIQSGFENLRACGFDISSTCDGCFIRNVQYGNIVTGPGAGAIRDRALNSIIESTRNAGSSRFAVGRNVLDPPILYFGTNMEDWVAATTYPCGLEKFNGTLTKETTTVRTGTNSAKMVMSVDLVQDIRIRLQPINMIRGKWVTVEAWVYNLTTAGLGYIAGSFNNGATIAYQPSFQLAAWERMMVSFYVDPADTEFTVKLTGLIGTVYWDSVKIWVSDWTPITQMTLDGTATPEISYGGYGGYFVPTFLTSGTPTITNFLKPHVGKPFTIHFAGATIIQANATIKLNGGVNFTGTADDSLTLCYRADGVFEEVTRSVNA